MSVADVYENRRTVMVQNMYEDGTIGRDAVCAPC